MWIIVIIFLIFSGFHHVYGQMQVLLQSPTSAQLRPEDSWRLRIQHAGSQPLSVYFVGIMQDRKGHTLVQVRSHNLSLAPGLHEIVPHMLVAAQTEYLDERVKKIITLTGNFPSGTYRICTTIRAAQDDTELQMVCQEHQVVNHQNAFSKQEENEPEGKSSWFTFHGKGSIEQMVASRAGNYQTLPRQYTRFQFNPSLSVANIPMGLNAFYTTEDQLPGASMNTFDFYFDTRQFTENLRDKAEKRLQKIGEEKAEQHAETLDKLKELQQLQQVLNDASLKEELAQVESLQQQLENTDIRSLQSTAHQLQTFINTEYRKIQYFDRKKKIEAALNRQKGVAYADSLKEVLRLHRIDSLQNKWQKLLIQKDSIEQKYRDKFLSLDSIAQRKQQYEQLQQQWQQLRMKKEEYEKLSAREQQLALFREQLEKSGKLSALSALDRNQLHDPEYLQAVLLEQGIMSKGERFLSHIDDFTIGTFYPYFSPLVLSGATLQGGSIAVSPGTFHFSVVGGKSMTPSFGLMDTLHPVREHNILAGKAGLGKEDGPHFSVHVLKTLNGPTNHQEQTAALSFRSLAPGQVLGTEAQVALARQKVRIQGEIAMSSGRSSLGAASTLSDRLAYQVGVQCNLFNNDTQLAAHTQRIGTGYHSPGVPFLQPGETRYDFTWSQAIWQQHIRLSSFYRWRQRPLFPQQTQLLKSIGGALDFRWKDLPTLTINFTQHHQHIEPTDFRTYSWHIISNYAYKIGDWPGSNTLMYSRTQSPQDTASFRFQSDHISWRQTLTFPWSMTTGLNLWYTNHTSVQNGSALYGMDLTTYFTLFQKLNASISYNFTCDTQAGIRHGSAATFSYEVLKSLQLSLEARYNTHSSFLLPEKSYKENWIRMMLSVNW